MRIAMLRDIFSKPNNPLNSKTLENAKIKIKVLINFIKHVAVPR